MSKLFVLATVMATLLAASLPACVNVHIDNHPRYGYVRPCHHVVVAHHHMVPCYPAPYYYHPRYYGPCYPVVHPMPYCHPSWGFGVFVGNPYWW